MFKLCLKCTWHFRECLLYTLQVTHISSPSATAALISAQHPAVLTASILLRLLIRLRALRTLTTPEIVNGCKSTHTHRKYEEATSARVNSCAGCCRPRVTHVSATSPQSPRDTCSFPGVIIQSTPHVPPPPRAYSTCCDMTTPTNNPPAPN